MKQDAFKGKNKNDEDKRSYGNSIYLLYKTVMNHSIFNDITHCLLDF